MKYIVLIILFLLCNWAQAQHESDTIIHDAELLIKPEIPA